LNDDCAARFLSHPLVTFATLFVPDNIAAHTEDRLPPSICFYFNLVSVLDALLSPFL
jgi:hypothetical protein